MRVLHVVATGERRGAEMFASDLVRALDGSASQRVAVLRAHGDPAVPYDAPVEVLGGNGWRVPGLRVDLRTVRTLGALLGRWRPELVQAHGAEPFKYAIAAAPRGRTPIVFRSIGPLSPGATRGPRRAGYRALVRRAARIVAVGGVPEREAVDILGASPRKVVTIPNAVDPRRVEPAHERGETRGRLDVDPESPLILAVGALAPDKDPLALVEVADRVVRRRRDAVFLLAGDGPLRSRVEGAIEERGLGGAVRTLGSRDDVNDLLGAADLLLLASSGEAMPACLIEAGMAGIPAAAYGISGVAEIVDDGVTGLLAPSGNAGALADRVLTILEDGHLRRALGGAAREICRTRFDMARIAPRYRRLYDEVTS